MEEGGDIRSSSALSLIEMLGLIYEDFDIDNIEEKYFRLVDEIFPFDRIALFFIKHGKGVLQGKLARGFQGRAIEAVEIPLDGSHLLARLLTTGLPLRLDEKESGDGLPFPGLSNSAFIPIVKRKRPPCWQIKGCGHTDCPVYGKSWLRCWLVADAKCGACGGASPQERPCATCPVFRAFDFETVEGVLLVDNSLTGAPIREEVVTALSILSHAVAVAINNSKRFKKTFDSSIRDELTGLYNRRYFNERLLDEIERGKRYGEPVSLISCDIDFFKQVNDTFGHPVGDQVLVWLAGLFREGLRKSDVIARYGGEEFMFLLLSTPKEQAREAAEKIRQLVSASAMPHGGGAIRVTISCGVAALGPDGGSLENLIIRADNALYAAKAQGRNRVVAA
ncbi:MAG: GGDEF domain-containing protein [Desulfobacteraceae bacterium]|nr:GGDEF domain-containing protein [Desulfobacteraceae bacterium]